MTDQIEKPDQALLKEFFAVLTTTEAERLKALIPYLDEDSRVHKTMLEFQEIWGKSESTVRRVLLFIQAKKIAGEKPLKFMRILETDEYIIEFSDPVLKVLYFLSE